MDNKKLNPANLFAMIGVAILILVAVWSGFQIIKYAPRALSNISLFNFLQSKPSINIKTDKISFKPGEEINLAWEIKGKLDGGVVSFLYQCTDGVVLEVYDDVNKTYRTLPCETPYNMPLNIKNLKIKLVQSSQNISLPIAIVYTNQNGEKYKSIIKISTIAKDDLVESGTNNNNQNISQTASSTETTPEETTSYNTGKEGTVESSVERASAATNNNTQTNNKCVSKIYGTPDLSIHNLRVGTIVNGTFIEKHIFSGSETLVVKFTVSNNGNKTTPNWRFDMLSPAKDKPVYMSGLQPKIPPCSGRYYTIKITGLRQGEHEVLVYIDPNNLIKELNEANNKAKNYVKVY